MYVCIANASMLAVFVVSLSVSSSATHGHLDPTPRSTTWLEFSDDGKYFATFETQSVKGNCARCMEVVIYDKCTFRKIIGGPLPPLHALPVVDQRGYVVCGCVAPVWSARKMHVRMTPDSMAWSTEPGKWNPISSGKWVPIE